MKHARLSVVAVVLAAGALTACTSAGTGATVMHASYATSYHTLSELVQAADIVVSGEVTGSEPAAEQDGIPFTDATFRVDSWIKGTGQVGDTVTIHQTGGTVDGRSFVMEYEPLLTAGEQAILYLQQADDVYFTLGGPTGRLTVKEGKVSKLPGTSLDESIPEAINDVIANSQSFSR
jgi:hypothetical protein